ncbi:formate/nitrite transporter family protein [Picosynechococcus sp. PCC 73109]|uniref:formate/nitrite transporter family protein n=1 Tax=Picosynechococcus sp. PCC 73109 TaxID=374982 RepID=UPI0007457F9C|nr:formate/nitrite transporter family protein [Picosynechococcus sp. PCC 73109]AMA07966.1 nitrite transporter [Picosynechococcus sp. PCC 73109]
MDYVIPKELVDASIKAGETKARLSVKDLLIRGFYSGLALGVATTLAVTVAVQSGLPFLGALLFPWGFASIVLFGMELVTGNFALMTSAMLARRVRFGRVINNWLWVYLGNFLGCLFVALLMGFSLTNGGTADPSPVGEKIIEIALSKTVAVKEMGINGFFLFIVRGIFCNFLVCLAVMMGMVSKSVPGKFMGCWFPIFAFVTLGLEHIVVNMFFILTGMVLGAPISGMDMVFWDFLPVTIGNIIGGGIFIGALLYSTHYTKSQGLPQMAMEESMKNPVLR